MERKRTSFARIIVTPLIVVAAGFLIAGLLGLMAGGVVSIAYILWASRR